MNAKLFNRRGKPAEPDFSRLPAHIAIILDGNGRWASRRGLPRTMGHKAGAENFRRMVDICGEIGIKYLTVYAFSTENWSRPAEEVGAIMSLLDSYLTEAREDKNRDRWALRFVGDMSALRPELQAKIAEAEDYSRENTGLHVNICLNYGGRAEILRAAQKLAARVKDGELSPENIDAELFSSCLDTAGIPDPELIIRPSGELRTSNFLLWESAYSEYYFTPVLWPDFDREELYRAIVSFQSRKRRFGAV